MEEAGGYDVNFVEEVADYLKCVICHFVVRDPVLLVDCGHRFCKTCFNNMTKHVSHTKAELLCPTDRTQVNLSKVYDDKSIGRAVMDLQVKCDHYVGGCQWTGELRNLKEHIISECCFREQQKASVLLEKLAKRIETCEKHLEEKDEQLEVLRRHVYQSDEKIAALKEQLEYTDRKLSDYISELKDEEWLMRHSPSLLEKSIQPACEEVPRTQSCKEQLRKIEEQIETLQHHVTNTAQLPNNEVVFIWKLENYTFHKEKAKTDGNSFDTKVYSSKFYSRVNGHCLRLFLKWRGKHKEILTVGINFCDDGKGGLKEQPFNADVKIEAVDKHGSERIHIMHASDIENEYHQTIDFKPGEDLATFGWATHSFINMPELLNFIIDDSLTIRCTMIPITP